MCSCATLMLGKNLVSEIYYRPKCSHPMRFQDFKSTLSQDKIDETASCFACAKNPQKLKVE